LVGDGPEKPALELQAAALGSDGVVFADPIAKSRVPDLLDAVDVGVVHATETPVYRYGVSFNKLFDYMAACLPVAFACGTAFDQVAASGAGLTVRPDDPDALAAAFVQLAQAGPESRRRMGEAGRRFLEREHDMAGIGREFADLVGCDDGPVAPAA
ncbi:MAG: glycosyltransferase family 4 protein, partial [Chloroflexi bacterium]